MVKVTAKQLIRKNDISLFLLAIVSIVELQSKVYHYVFVCTNQALQRHRNLSVTGARGSRLAEHESGKY